MAEFHISIPDGNILIEQPPVQGISRLRSNCKFFLVFGRWFLLSTSLTDDRMLAEHIHAVDYFWLSAYLGNSYLNSFGRKKKFKKEGGRDRRRERRKGEREEGERERERKREERGRRGKEKEERKRESERQKEREKKGREGREKGRERRKRGIEK